MAVGIVRPFRGHSLVFRDVSRGFLFFFGIFTPKPWGRWIQFDDHIFQLG